MLDTTGEELSGPIPILCVLPLLADLEIPGISFLYILCVVRKTAFCQILDQEIWFVRLLESVYFVD